MKKCTFCDSELLLFEENESAMCWLCGGTTFVDVEEEEARRRQKEKEKKELCCPAPGCSVALLENHKTFCGDCGRPLQRATLELWIRKCVDPRLKNNSGQGVLDKARLFDEAWQMGHSKKRAEEALDQYLAEVAPSASQPQQSSASANSRLHGSVELLLDPRRKDKHDLDTASLTSPRISAKSFYRRLAAGGSVTNNLTYLDLKTSASKDGLRNTGEFLKECSPQGAFVLFVSSENQGWVFPNPKLIFTPDSLKPLFPTLTADQFNNFKEHIEPVQVVRVGKGRWKVRVHQNGPLRTQVHDTPGTDETAPKIATPPAAFPILASDYLAKMKRFANIVKFDVLNCILISDPDGSGEFILTRDPEVSDDLQPLFVIPRVTRFQMKQEFYNYYEKYYDCARPAAGDVWIIKPAIVSAIQGGWQLMAKGVLEIDFVAKQRPAVPSAVAEVVTIEQEQAPEAYPTSGPLVNWRLVVGIIASLVILAAVIVGVLRRSDPPIAKNNASPTPSPPADMVRVEGGEFQMGSITGDEYEMPVHKVYVKSFFIDVNEVTCEKYQEFVKATSHRIPSYWIRGQYPAGAAQKPVTGVDWEDASAYARWASKRLPTEEEWEFAARGTTGWRYPWGDEWRADAANAGDSKAGRFADVGSYPAGQSPFGMMDLIGNAWEWTATEWKGYPNSPVPPDASNESRVIRGGYWGSSALKATTTFRRGWPARDAKEGYKNTGFRCAADVNAQTK